MFTVYGVCSVGGAVTPLCVALMIKGGNDVTRRAQGVTGNTRRAGVFTGVLCMEGARCVRRCVSCERGVWTCGACAFMWARIRGVITSVKSWGRNGVVWYGHEKTPLVPCGYRGCWLGVVMRVRALRGWCGGRWSLRTFRR